MARNSNPFNPPAGRGKRIIFWVLAVVLSILCVLVLLSTLTVKRKSSPSVLGYGLFVMETGEMETAVPKDAAVLVKREIDPAQLVKGDVVVCKGGRSGAVLARIVETDGVTFRTKGDAEEGDGTLHTGEEIWGLAVSFVPGIGAVFAFFQTALGIACCITVPLGVLIVFQLVHLVRVIREKDEADEEPEDEEEEGSPLVLAASRRAAAKEEAFPRGRRSRPADEEDVFSREERSDMRPTEPPPVFTGPGRGEGPRLAFSLEQEEVELAKEKPAPRPVSFEKTAPQPSPFLQSTREFSLREPEDAHIRSVPASAEEPVTRQIPTGRAPSAEQPPRMGASSPSPQSPPSADPLAVPQAPYSSAASQSPKTGTSSPSPQSLPGAHPLAAAQPPVPQAPQPLFLAEMAAQGRDRFQIDGMNVQVRPDGMKLSFEEGDRDVTVTVTEDCTSVTVGTGRKAVDFALARDENGQKVVIRRKARPAGEEQREDEGDV